MDIYLIIRCNVKHSEPHDPYDHYVCAFLSFEDAIRKARTLADHRARHDPNIVRRYDATVTALVPFASVCVLSNGDVVRFEVHKDFAL